MSDSRFLDSGWRFLSEEETDVYANNPNNIGIYSILFVITTSILFLYCTPLMGRAFEKNEDGVFVPIEDFFEEIEDVKSHLGRNLSYFGYDISLKFSQ